LELQLRYHFTILKYSLSVLFKARTFDLFGLNTYNAYLDFPLQGNIPKAFSTQNYLNLAHSSQS
jgi:hypothetical protein